MFWSESRSRWVSVIGIGNKKFPLGRFIDKTEAVAHRLAAEQCLDWQDCDSSSPAYKFISSRKISGKKTGVKFRKI